jgi:predicted TPR repeat methyltransferase
MKAGCIALYWPAGNPMATDSDDAPEEQTLTVDEALALAVRLMNDGDLDTAEALCDGALAAAPEHPDALHFRGLLFCQRGQPEPALEVIERARTLAPDNGHIHNNLGNLLFGEQRVEEAAQSYRRAIALLPELKPAHFNLSIALRHLGRGGEAMDVLHAAATHFPCEPELYRQTAVLLRVHGRTAEAAEVYRKWLAIDPDNQYVQHMLAAASADATPDRLTDAAVQETFARFAASFDRVMARLEYRAPALIAAALGELLPPPAGDRAVLDAGCGTGLCADLLRPYARRLVGVDLSPEMLAKASERGGYDQLVAAELASFLRDGAAGAWQVVVSADTLVYFGALGEVMAAAAHALAPGGLLVFTVERSADADAPAGFRLHNHGRYSHGEAYLRVCLTEAGLEARRLDAVILRREAGVPVEGWLVAAARPAI